MNISYERAIPSESLGSKVKPEEIEVKQEGHEHDSQATAESKSSRKNTNKNREDRVVLSQPFLSSRALEWVVHLLAVSISIIGICWLRFLPVYWTDEPIWTTSWAWAFFDLDGNLKALQFITKVHTLLMIASIASITVNFSRRRLVGHKGVAFDNLWYTVNFITKDSATIGLSIFILCSAILCQLVGLASIGVIQPNLGWWHVPNPYGSQALPLYIQSKKNETFPLKLNSTTIPTSTAGLEWDMDSCLTAAPQTPAFACPGYGFEALGDWTLSNFQNHPSSNLTVVESITGAQRILAAESLGNGTVIAATQSNWVVRLYALFNRYIQLHHLGPVNSISNPMYTSADPIYAPVVQVQCHAIDGASANHSGISFLTNKLTNYTEAGAICNGRNGLVNFNWVDLSSEKALEGRGGGQTTKLDSTWRPSIGAVATIPGMLGNQPTSYIVPCIVDARWAASSAWYEPSMSGTVKGNLSNPGILTRSTVGFNLDGSVPAKAKSRQQWGIGDPIHISPNWAELLNTPGHLVGSSITATSIEAMLYSYVTRLNNADFAVFTMTSSDGTFVTDSADLMERAADKVATILSLAIADGLSRITDWSDSLVVLDTNGDNITYSYLNALSDRNDYADWTSYDIEANTFLRLRVQRYGWAYGWSIITILSIVVLSMHISMVVWYTGYQFRKGGDSIELFAGKKYI
ncbi:uncharacterized protein Triagg1_7032 [Trichoderma aggressivum f. europaeum]|uniref:Uncharacterized protein n=1 Tax=Trichoderma aggressivum f. europaeum TaxID=173218 RepID=A0AAE1IEG5_9HYPO|nr:hypothetical protein Triagg1_7032 [Trichoderma aggressivum f. europaeum]